MIVVRGVFQAKYGMGDELVELFREAHEIWPSGSNPRILTDLSGPFFTVISEAEYESFSAWEVSRDQIFADERVGPWFERMQALVKGGHREFYTLVG